MFLLDGIDVLLKNHELLVGKRILLKFVAPTSIKIGGPSNCGKTYLVKNILQNSEGMFTKLVSHIIYCYGSPWQPLFDELQEVLKEKSRFRKEFQLSKTYLSSPTKESILSAF